MPAVGSVTITRSRLQKNLEAITIAWTSDGAGAVSGNPFAVGAGPLWQAKFVPGSGADQPDDNYDVTINDEDGCDVLLGDGVNLSNSEAAIVGAISPIALLDGQALDLVVANAGDSKMGTVTLIIGRFS